MDHNFDPNSIMGMAGIIADDDMAEDTDMKELNEIEKSIITGMDLNIKKAEKSVDRVKEYKDEIEKLSKHFDMNANKVIDIDEDDDLDKYPSIMKDDAEGDQNDEIEVDTDYAPTKVASPTHTYSTHEEMRQKQIDQVLSRIDKPKDTDQYLQEEDAEDEMARILEQIDLLRTNLEAEGVDLTRIQTVDTNTSFKEAKSVLKILQIKNDRMRYCDMFEEGLIACAYGLESVFDGKNVWFGKQIDLTGWSETVKVKLRRMRYDTSQFVSETVKGYSLGSGWRILLELLPSLFLYSRDRKLRSNDSIASDAKYKNALRDLR